MTLSNKHITPKSISDFLLFLGMLFVVVNVSADILAYKMIGMGPFLMSVGVFIVPFSYAITDVTTEVYGYKVSKRVIWLGLLAEFLFDLICYLGSLTKSPQVLNNDMIFTQTLQPLLHVYMAVFIANVASYFLNIYCISKWKILTQGKYFWLRSIGSSGIAELVFTVICDGIVFYGTLPNGSVIHTIFSTFSIKMACAILLSFPLSLLANILKRMEHTDTYDYHVNFNPFKP